MPVKLHRIKGMLLVAQAAATAYLTGLIWFVQLVHYPLMAKVGNDTYREYQAAHQSLTAFAVGPPMLVELLTAALLLINSRSAPAAIGLVLVAIVWGSTFFLQIPQHDILSLGFDANAHARLVSTNWIRTLAWTARAGIAFHMLRDSQ